jgi:hypothetical protein
MGSQVTLQTVRAACTPNALRKIRDEQLRSTIDMLNLQRQSLSELTEQEVTTRSRNIAPKYEAQYQKADLRLIRLHDRDATCGDLNYHKSKSDELKTTVQLRDSLKARFDNLCKKYSNVSKRNPAQKKEIAQLHDQWIKAQDLASKKAKELAKIEGETIKRFRNNSSDVLFKQGQAK